MTPQEYQCGECNRIFNLVETDEWNDDKAIAEMEENGWVKEECSLVCDDCYKELMEWIQIDDPRRTD
jgi:hypothetical protein